MTITVMDYHDCPEGCVAMGNPNFEDEPREIICATCNDDGFITVTHEVPREELETELSELSTRFAGPRGPASDNYHPEKRALLQPRIDELRELLGRHFWQRTQAAVRASHQMPVERHRKYVKGALEEGKSVPAEVLAEYPELSETND